MPSDGPTCVVIILVLLITGAVLYSKNCDDKFKPCPHKFRVDGTIVNTTYESYNCTLTNLPKCTRYERYCKNNSSSNLSSCPRGRIHKRCAEFMDKTCYTLNILVNYNDTLCNITVDTIEYNTSEYDNMTTIPIDFKNNTCTLSHSLASNRATFGVAMMITSAILTCMLCMYACSSLSSSVETSVDNPLYV